MHSASSAALHTSASECRTSPASGGAPGFGNAADTPSFTSISVPSGLNHCSSECSLLTASGGTRLSILDKIPAIPFTLVGNDWISGVEKVFQFFERRTPGSYTERTTGTLTWYWDDALSDLGKQQVRESHLYILIEREIIRIAVYQRKCLLVCRFLCSLAICCFIYGRARCRVVPIRMSKWSLDRASLKCGLRSAAGVNCW